MTYQCDLFVVGTGAAGSTAAHRCRAAGWTVGIVDERPFGGTCALRGCDPKKVLVGAARVVDAAERFSAQGVTPGSIGLDWKALMGFKRTFTDPVPHEMETSFTAAGIQTFSGPVRFTGTRTLVVGETDIEAGHILIASGAVPAPLDIPGEEHLVTSEEFLNWDHLPDRVLFVGGGYISMEFAHVALRAGAHVSVLHRDAHPLPGFDAELVEHLLTASQDRGLVMHRHTEVVGIRAGKNGLVVEARQNGVPREFVADAVVHGAGRVPDLAHLELESAHVAYGSKGVTVDERLQSPTNPAVYAAGDAAATPGRPLTPVASMEGNRVADVLLGLDRPAPDYTGIPTILYTIPALASVGLREDEARHAGYPVTVHRHDMSGWYTARQQLAPVAGSAVLVQQDTDKILGAHVLGPHAESLINIFSLAIRLGIPASILRQHPFAYPTGASDLTYLL